MPLPSGIRIMASTDMRGGNVTTTEIPDDALHAVFPPIDGAAAQGGKTEYACVYLVNTSNTTLFRVRIYIKSQPDGRTVREVFAIGLDPQTGSPVQSIPNINTAPSGVTFSSPTKEEEALEIPIFPSGSVRALWLRRTIPPNTEPASIAKCVLGISFVKLS